MDVLNVFSVPTEKYTRVKCRRIGVELDWFNCVYGRSILSGKTTYVSKKNYRSNKEFDTYKSNNGLKKKILIVLSRFHPEKSKVDFQDNPDYFMSPNFEYDYDVIIFGFGGNNFKVKKAKTFYVKASKVLYKEEGKFLLVDNLTLETVCTFPC